MSYISEKCKEEMVNYEKEVNELYEKYVANCIKLFTGGTQITDNDILAKFKKASYMEILNKNINDEHMKIYEEIVSADYGNCMCNLCVGGYAIFFEDPLYKLFYEIKIAVDELMIKIESDTVPEVVNTTDTIN